MATRRQAEARLAKLGFELSAESGPMPLGGFDVCIDAIGRNTVDGECRGQCVFDYTAKASDFWTEVIREAESLPPPTPCPYPIGDCEFHDPPEDAE